MEQTKQRTARLIPLREAKSLGVILNLENDTCALSVKYLDAQAAEYGLQLKYLLVNPYKVEIPQWALRADMSVMNFKQDYDGRCRFITDTADRFCLNKFDYLLAVSSRESDIIDAIADSVEAGFKIGRAARHDSIYDLTVRIGFAQRREDPARLLLSSLKVLTRELNQQEDEGK